jgi:hypothetical protein
MALAHVRHRARSWLRGLRIPRGASLAPRPAADVVLDLDATYGDRAGDRTGTSQRAVFELRLAVDGNVIDDAGATSSLVDDIASSLKF